MKWLLGVGCAIGACGRVGFAPVQEDGRTDGAAMACPEFATLCDDFESGDTTKWARTLTTSRATLGVQQAIAHWGVFALDVDVAMQPTTARRMLLVVDRAPPITGMWSTRAWLRAPRALSDYEGTLIFSRNDAFDGYVETVCDNQGRWSVSESPNSGQITSDHPSAIPCLANTWQCVELDYTFGTSPRIQLYIDDVLVVDVAAELASGVQFAMTGIGVARAAREAIRVFVDDVVMADRHIGCN